MALVRSCWRQLPTKIKKCKSPRHLVDLTCLWKNIATIAYRASNQALNSSKAVKAWNKQPVRRPGVRPNTARLAQLDKRQSAKRDVAGSKLGRCNMYKKRYWRWCCCWWWWCQFVNKSIVINNKSVPGSVTARWLERKQLTWNWYVFPALNFWIRCSVSGVVKLSSSEVSSTSKYVTMYFSIMPFLHFSFHDNTVAPSSACCTDTSGMPGTVAKNASMDSCKQATSQKKKKKKQGLKKQWDFFCIFSEWIPR